MVVIKYYFRYMLEQSKPYNQCPNRIELLRRFPGRTSLFPVASTAKSILSSRQRNTFGENAYLGDVAIHMMMMEVRTVGGMVFFLWDVEKFEGKRPNFAETIELISEE